MAACTTATTSTLPQLTDSTMTTQSLKPVEPPGAGTQPAFPAIHDIPPQREVTTLSDYEQRKLENDLVAARNRLGRTQPDTEKPRP